jgi:hypothetical protein
VFLSWLLQPAVGYVVTAILGAVVQAWTASRLKGIKERRKFSKRVLKILALCSNLEGTINIEGASAAADRERWIGQLDEAIRWLADNWQRYALTFIDVADVRKLITGYGGAACAAWQSAAPLDERLRKVRGLTERVNDVYFASGRLRRVKQVGAAKRELKEMIGTVTAGE